MIGRRAPVAIPVSSYVFALPHTATKDRIEVLLVKRRLVQTCVDGRAHRGIVPNWAGQWGLIAARPLVSQSMEETVQGAVLAQTGIDLSAPASAERYRIIGAEPRTLEDGEGRSVAVLFLTFLPEGLRAFAADAMEHLSADKVRDGVIETLGIEPVSRALELIEPCSVPPGAWSNLASTAGNAGRVQAQLKSVRPELAKPLVERSAMVPAGARLAVGTLAAFSEDEASPPAPTPNHEARLLELHIAGARRTESGLWYQTHHPGQSVQIQALTDPAVPASGLPIEWLGGEPDHLGRRDWRALPLDRLSPRGAPFSIKAILGSHVREVRIAVVPSLTGVEVSRAHGAAEVDAGPHSDQSGKAWVRAVLSPVSEEAFRYLKWYGGAVDPKNPLDRRLISIPDLVAGGKGMAVELDLGLG